MSREGQTDVNGDVYWYELVWGTLIGIEALINTNMLKRGH